MVTVTKILLSLLQEVKRGAAGAAAGLPVIARACVRAAAARARVAAAHRLRAARAAPAPRPRTATRPRGRGQITESPHGCRAGLP